MVGIIEIRVHTRNEKKTLPSIFIRLHQHISLVSMTYLLHYKLAIGFFLALNQFEFFFSVHDEKDVSTVKYTDGYLVQKF